MNQPIEEKWKRDLSRLAIKYGTGTEIRGRCEIYEIKELTAFIENLLEQERQRMSDEIENLPTFRVPTVRDREPLVKKEKVKAIINK